MSTEPNRPAEDAREESREDSREAVHDGVGARPVPREAPDEQRTVADKLAGSESGNEVPDAGNGEVTGNADSTEQASTEDVTRSSGPAEERDSKSPDTRGLTTDTAPSE